MTFIRIASDLHLEFYNKFRIKPLPEDKETILVLAGDICAGKKIAQFEPFFKDVSERFAEIIYVFGNHEFYGGSIIRTPEKFQKTIGNKYPNIHIFNNNAEAFIKDDIVFICATLWTDFNNGDPIALWDCNQIMNDFKKIRTGTTSVPYKKRFRSNDAMMMHKIQLSQMVDLFKEYYDRKIVVVTHHAPCILSCDDEFRGSKTIPAYYSDLSTVIHQYNPKVWISGHVHTNSDYQLFNTRCITNPKGYAQAIDDITGEEIYQNKEFDQLLRIEL